MKRALKFALGAAAVVIVAGLLIWSFLANRAELAAETERYADQSTVELTAPVSGSVWELLAAPGEEVRRGQDLMRLLDGSGLRAELIDMQPRPRLGQRLFYTFTQASGT